MDDQTQVEKRLGWLAGIILLWGALILVRLVMLQVVHHQDYLRAARKAQEIEVKIPAHARQYLRSQRPPAGHEHAAWIRSS